MTDTIKDDLLRRAHILLLCALRKSGVMTIGEVEGQEWLREYEAAMQHENTVTAWVISHNPCQCQAGKPEVPDAPNH